MHKPTRSRRRLLAELQERAKELSCLYQVEEQLNRSEATLDEILQEVMRVIPRGFMHASVCQARLTFQGKTYASAPFEETPWRLELPLRVQDEVIGQLGVFYTREMPPEDEGPFLKEERRLVATLAERLGHFAFYQRLKNLQHNLVAAGSGRGEETEIEWRAPVHLLRDSDKSLYLRIARRMLNHLTRIGVEEARLLLIGSAPLDNADDLTGEVNMPLRQVAPDLDVLLSDRPFELAAEHLSTEEILSRVQKWMVEDKASGFMRTLNSMRSSVPELADALRRFHQVLAGRQLPTSTLKSLRVSLTQRLLTEQLDFVRTAKEFVEIEDFVKLVDRIIMPAGSHGKLGGKGAGLLLAHKVLERTQSPDRPVGDVRIPRTWFVASDGLLDFVAHNDLQDVIEQKYKEIDSVRDEYPSIVRLFKSSTFPPRVINGLSVALDDFGDVPLIVRSSSLLEDRLGTAFSGKYKSLFLANQGTKTERLSALMDATAEVYASTFGPDPIEYRRDHGLLEFNEEMGILIQEVVGIRLGRFFLPAFAGVAFSNNEFRWSPRIKREDGLLRIVAGLGTRAVDRVSDDYPILAVPGQPHLRANVAIDEIVRYSPQQLDLINLETRQWETRKIADLLEEVGPKYPLMQQLFSILKDDMLHPAQPMLVDPKRDQLVLTCQGLFGDTPFMEYMRNMMSLLQEHLATPVDLEFAHDGKHFYLLQCRPQSYSGDASPAPIPKDLDEKDIVFTAERYVSNGYVPDITHIVYVDPAAYAELETRNELLAIGRAVGQLNKLLPKRQFVLMGPGRWGSRGDLKLGVSVTYADISNTAMLIEVARRRGGYVPDLSFGTHFFQDLVEARIRYLPLYPDQDDIIFNERLLLGAPNLLTRMLPACAGLAETIRVIDVPALTDGRILRILQNAELNEAVGYLAAPDEVRHEMPATDPSLAYKPVQYWQWRSNMAARIAQEIDGARLGVIAIYLFGSTKNATAGPGSDIDLLVHFRGTPAQREILEQWLDGWSLCLGEINYLRTGYRTDRLLDVHIVTDEDIAKQTSFAVKIGAVTDAARPLTLGRPPKR